MPGHRHWIGFKMSMPTVFSIWTAARLLDVFSAVLIVISVALECSSSGTHLPWSVSIGLSSPVITVAGLKPASSAAANTNGLNAEPDCRLAWVARLKRLSLKSRPPTKAATCPVVGSIDTSEA